MFNDPQTVTYANVAKTLPAISRGETSSDYKLNDAGVVYQLTLSHQFAKRNRVSARLRRDNFADDPLVESNNVLASVSSTLTIDYPLVGMTSSDAQVLANALIAWATPANVLKLVNGET